MDKFDTVRDSSVWYSPSAFSAMDKRDPYLRVGIVQQAFADDVNNDIRYLVEVQDKNDKVVASCRMMRRFGGIFNYEDVVHRGYKTTAKPDIVNDFSAKAGDIVIVIYFNGQTREGLILGGITHPGRVISLDPSLGPQYQSEFNGLQTIINSDGEWTLTFRGQPTNIGILSNVPTEELPAPEYDTDIGSTFMKLDKTGGWTINDNASDGQPQFIHIDKASGIITTQAGKISLTMTKSSEAVSLTCKTTTINSDTSITANTQTLQMNATTSAAIKSPKIAFGTDGIELLDEIIQLVDALAKVTPISPIGPCTANSATPQWPAVDAIKAKIQSIKGSL